MLLREQGVAWLAADLAGELAGRGVDHESSDRQEGGRGGRRGSKGTRGMGMTMRIGLLPAGPLVNGGTSWYS